MSIGTKIRNFFISLDIPHFIRFLILSILFMGFLLVWAGLAHAYTEAHGITLTDLAAANDAPGGVIVRSYTYNWTIINMTRQSNVLTPDKCYVWPNGTTYNYASPLTTGTYSGATCIFSPALNISVNTTVIIATDRVLGNYNSYSKNPAAGVPGLQGNITSWMGGVYSNSAETTFSLYPTALVDVIAIGVENNTKPEPPIDTANHDSIAFTSIINSSSNESIFASWQYVGNYSYTTAKRDGVLFQNSTELNFSTDSLVPNTQYSINLTLYWNSTLYNSTTFNIFTKNNTIIPPPETQNLTALTNLINLSYQESLKQTEALSMIWVIVSAIVIFGFYIVLRSSFVLVLEGIPFLLISIYEYQQWISSHLLFNIGASVIFGSLALVTVVGSVIFGIAHIISDRKLAMNESEGFYNQDSFYKK